MSTSKLYVWSAINRIGVQIIGFIGNVLIARSLSPDDYGLIAMLSIILGISGNLTESGFADSLIRKHDADRVDFGTVLTHNVSISIIVYIILYFSAPLIAQFFKREELIAITRIISISIILKALTIAEFTRMRKELEFKKFAIIQLLSSFISILVAYIAARNGFGYYALVLQAVTLSAINIFLVVIINNWIPVFYFNLHRYRKMRKFSNHMLLSYFSNQIGQNIFSVFVGKYHPTVSLGYFSQATKINEASTEGLNAVILNTSYPIIAKEKNQILRNKKYKELTQFFLYSHFCASFLILGGANYIILFLFGEKWQTTTYYLQLITLSTLYFPLMTINSNILKTENKTNIYRNLTFIRNALSLLTLSFTFRNSIHSILFGLIIARYISVLIDMLICGKYINFGFLQQTKIIAFQIISPILAMLVAYFGSSFFETNIVNLIVYLVVYIILFLLFNSFFGNEIQKYIFLRVQKYFLKVL